MFKKYFPIIFWLSILVLLELAFRFGNLNKAFIPAPSQVILNFGQSSFWKILGLDLLETLSRFWISILIGYALTQICLLLIVYFNFAKVLSSQINFVLKYLPLPVLIPFAILGFGISEVSVIAVMSLSAFVIYFDFALNIIKKEESGYRILQNSWKLSPWKRYWNFILPLTNRLCYRVIPALITWILGIGIISEVILGIKDGLGVRLQQFQQLFKPDLVISYTVVILLVAFGIERILTNYFAVLKNSFYRFLALSLILASCLVSGVYLGLKAAWVPNSHDTKSITSYKAVANLPIFVMLEKYNSLNYNLKLTSDGIQSLNGLLTHESTAAGFSDMPNALGATAKNPKLKIVAQVVEQPDKPVLFLISSKLVNQSDVMGLKGSKIGYFPNNSLIKAGLEAAIFGFGSPDKNTQFSSTSDPSLLVQSYLAGNLDAVLVPEPYASEIENRQNITRFNPSSTLIKQISFESLPLASLLIDTENLNQGEQQKLVADLQLSQDFITQNTESQVAMPELAKIMQKYDLIPTSHIPVFQDNRNLKPEDTVQILKLTQLLDTLNDSSDLTKLDVNQIYWHK